MDPFGKQVCLHSFPLLEWHSCSHLILFYDGIPSAVHSVGSFSPAPSSEVLYLKFRLVVPQFFVRAILTEIWSQILLDKFIVQLLFLGLELCGHLIESPTFN